LAIDLRGSRTLNSVIWCCRQDGLPKPCKLGAQKRRFATANCNLTCIVPFRRRMPDIFDQGSELKLVSAAGVAPGACARPPTPVPSRVRWLLCYALTRPDALK